MYRLLSVTTLDSRLFCLLENPSLCISFAEAAAVVDYNYEHKRAKETVEYIESYIQEVGPWGVCEVGGRRSGSFSHNLILVSRHNHAAVW